MMRNWIGVRRAFAVMVCSAVLALSANSAGAGEAQPVVRTVLQRAPLGGNPDTEVIVTRLEVPPGAEVPRHIHPGDEVVYVLQAGRIQAPGEAPRDLAVGQTLRFPRGQLHGGFTVVGNVTLRVLTVHIVDAGKPLTQLVE